MKKAKLLSIIALTSIAGSVCAEEAIEKVMKEAFKGNTSLYNTVVKGNGTDEDAKKLLGYAKTMAESEPPRGDKAEWDKRNKDLVSALELVVSGKKEALEQVNKAGNCKACHSAHKPK